jgi:hypothetical protein
MFADQDTSWNALQGKPADRRVGATTRSHSPIRLLVLPPQGVYLDANTPRDLPARGVYLDANNEILIGIAIRSLFASLRGSQCPCARFALSARLCWDAYV